MFSKSKRMYSWEIITINCHSEKSFFFFISCYCQMSVSISSQIYLFWCIRRSLPPEFCWSRHQFLSSCENWVSVGHSHCIHAPQSEGENRSQWYMYHLLDDNHFTSQAPTTVPRKITHTFSQSSTKRNCTPIAKVN